MIKELLVGSILLKNLEKYDIILASGSPRRRELLEGLGLDFEIQCLKSIDESYPSDLPHNEIAEYISKKKAAAYKQVMLPSQLIITADTVVVSDKGILGKPKDRQDAINMLMTLSGKTHQVITGVTITAIDKQVSFSSTTDVVFDNITTEEAEFYVDNYNPMDKAGAYGIQEWIGYVAVKGISGSYYNVMGLPIQKLYTILKGW